MQQSERGISLSASDLVGHLNCRFLTKLDCEVAFGEREKPIEDGARLDAIRRRGFEHEARYVDYLRKQGLEIDDVGGDRITPETVERTIALMKKGADIIVQAAFDDGIWRGKADILRKVRSGKSLLGDWSYEVIDTKLASETKGGTILQLCLYAEFIQKIQGFTPERVYVVPPTEYFEEQVYRTNDYLAYFRKVKRRLEDDVASRDFKDVYAEPVAHCDVCRWQRHCNAKRHHDDHLSLVADITKIQRLEFEKQKIKTVTELAKMPLPLKWKPERGSKDSIVKIREQARIQVEGRSSPRTLHELFIKPDLSFDEEFGLSMLPEPSRGDIFLDIEGDPFVGREGLEYLFGYAYEDEKGALVYKPVWAKDANGEKKAFDRFMDFAFKRFSLFPDLHIYHYAAYEPSALKRLMGRYAIREIELDQFLRGKRFVDLHRVVKRSLRASVESYSIKKLEPLFGFRREQDLREASIAKADLEMNLESGMANLIENEQAERVEAYNKDDCLSVRVLRDWLERERGGLLAKGVVIQRPQLLPGDPEDGALELKTELSELYKRLMHNVPLEAADRTSAQNAYWLIANMLEWHARERKVSLWEKFRLMELDDEELLEDGAAITGLKFEYSHRNEEGDTVFRYSFPAQETDLRRGSAVFTSDGKDKGKISDISGDEGWVEFERDIRTDGIAPTTVISVDLLPFNAIKGSIAAIRKIAESIAADGFERRDHFGPAKSLLLNEGPLFHIRPLKDDTETVLDAACRLVHDLNGRVLSIQGPPGTGKTHTAACMIISLIEKGKRVGITATSHKVIKNLVDKVFELSAERKMSFRCIMRDDDEQNPNGGVQNIRLIRARSNEDIERLASRTDASMIGGTSFFWARQNVESLVDVLFVDEAAQMSLANVIASSQGARSLVLIGDPQQLEQPLKGTHPEGTDQSSLDHVLGASETIAADHGLFLDTSFRLSPDICSFTSELFYEGRLHAFPKNEKQALDGPAPFAGSGLRYVPVQHEGNQNQSNEEAEAVATVFATLTKGAYSFINNEGESNLLKPEDVLIVAPYNLQVYKMRKRIPKARIGTVDKFQGQEAPVVIYSLTSSSQHDAPRGMEFLYSLNRLNVATSRAKAMCIIVGSEKLFFPSCSTPRQIQLANAFCRYREISDKIDLIS
jgi:predicted RecB family nuclease